MTTGFDIVTDLSVPYAARTTINLPKPSTRIGIVRVGKPCADSPPLTSDNSTQAIPQQFQLLTKDHTPICVDVIQSSHNTSQFTYIQGQPLSPQEKFIGWDSVQTLHFPFCNSLILFDQDLNVTVRNIRFNLGKYLQGSPIFAAPEGDQPQKENGAFVWAPGKSGQYLLSAEELKGHSIKDEPISPASLGSTHTSRIVKTCRVLKFNAVTPLLHGTMHREFYVPQWGDRVRVTESYELTNEGAGLDKAYLPSQINDHMTRMIGTRRAQTPTPFGGHAFTFDAYFPANTRDIEFYDKIGNISTSLISKMVPDQVQSVELEPRFPLLGQWKTHWTVRYHGPQKNFVARSPVGSIKNLDIPMVGTLENFWADSSTLSVILPPFAKPIRLESTRITNGPVLELETTKERRWFDLLPTRTKIDIRVKPLAIRSSALNNKATTGGEDVLLRLHYEESWNRATASHALWLPILISVLIIFLKPAKKFLRVKKL